MDNSTEVSHFILLGLTNASELQIPLFILFTLIYLISLFGNLGMIALILLDSQLHTPMYFFLSTVMVLSCSDRHVGELVLVFVVGFNICFALLVILISYLFIFSTILKMQTAEGYWKALSTCGSHFTAVSIFYGTVIFMYLQPSSSHSMDTDKVASVFYAVVIPMLNPLVYSLRNKEVKSAFKKVVGKIKLSLGLSL
ncbi:olfactory receptor 5B3-like [Orycteropus afer afer]|uniref:Olfactory receptor 5B3-like n=1 Tax=Orycteropus afer afer TaxID=1230840 RepID=A0AC54Z719_ORYAF|nr:olfactory receptor 5B3-like [Orycteropus afer afer]